MKIDTVSPRGSGHPVTTAELAAAALGEHAGLLVDLFEGRRSAVVVRGAFPEAAATAARLRDAALAPLWRFPNEGMTGGEVRVIGEAATPTFTRLRGPSVEQYGAAARRHAEQRRAVFGERDPRVRIEAALGGLLGGDAAPAPFDADTTWSPFTIRVLEPGECIYAHHDHHYRLAVYERLPAELDRSTLISWFIVLQAPEQGGELMIYGLWGDDPDPPMLPTRFLDVEVLERDYPRRVYDLRAGDLVAFDSGRHVHRVAPVQGSRARMTLGGFCTLDPARRRVAYWS